MRNHEDSNTMAERIVEFVEETKLLPLWQACIIYWTIGAFFGAIYGTLRKLILHM